jgi:hypothetical protein
LAHFLSGKVKKDEKDKKMKQLFIQDWLQNAEAGCNSPEFTNYMAGKVEEWSVLKRKLSLYK